MILIGFIKDMVRCAQPQSSPLILLILMATLTSLTACSTVSVRQQDSAKTISAQRGNIVTDNRLSSDTAAALLSAGLDEQGCMQRFERCLTQIQDSILEKNHRSTLAIFAELHYAKARQLANSQACASALTRPPLDPYYANAPLSAADAHRQELKTGQCVNRYQAHLFDAIKSSYAYLFYNSLTPDSQNNAQSRAHSGRQNAIPSETDIQTQDIYHAASSDVITQRYHSPDGSNELMGQPKITPLPIGEADDSAQAAIANHAPLAGHVTDQIEVMKIDISDYQLSVYLPNETSYLQSVYQKDAVLADAVLADLVSTYELRLSGLNSLSKRSGIGISLVASLDNRHTTTVRQLLASSRLTPSADKADTSTKNSAAELHIYPTGHLLLTGLVVPDGDTVSDVLNSRKLDIHLYNPYQSEQVTILNNTHPLAANFSAGYGLWLSENQLSGVGYLNLITRQPEQRRPKLFMLEPYNPNKRVLIMLHGLASSPETWVNLTNDILNDDTLRDHYQVWQVFYPTNLPILENRYQIQRLIDSAYQQTDPKGQHIASKNSVIIGHSMGAVIARMMLSDENLIDKLDRIDTQNRPSNSAKNKIQEALNTSFAKERLTERFKLRALPQVDTAIFLSAPFRGTDYADRWFTRALRRIVYLPVGLVKTVTENLATIATQGDLAQDPLASLYLQNGASQLSDKSSFIQLTQDISINERITYHSIIANNDTDITKGLAQLQPNTLKTDQSESSTTHDSDAIKSTVKPLFSDEREMVAQPAVPAVSIEGTISQALTERLSDGIVPYTSAHLDGAASETIINGGHSIQENPQTILTLRRILHQQLRP